jgi:hypothetical protein
MPSCLCTSACPAAPQHRHPRARPPCCTSRLHAPPRSSPRVVRGSRDRGMHAQEHRRLCVGPAHSAPCPVCLFQTARTELHVLLTRWIWYPLPPRLVCSRRFPRTCSPLSLAQSHVSPIRSPGEPAPWLFIYSAVTSRLASVVSSPRRRPRPLVPSSSPRRCASLDAAARARPAHPWQPGVASMGAAQRPGAQGRRGALADARASLPAHSLPIDELLSKPLWLPCRPRARAARAVVPRLVSSSSVEPISFVAVRPW